MLNDKICMMIFKKLNYLDFNYIEQIVVIEDT